METYEIELRANGIEFDYVIAAADGTILAQKQEAENPKDRDENEDEEDDDNDD